VGLIQLIGVGAVVLLAVLLFHGYRCPPTGVGARPRSP
jgi:hypothetical protein